MKKLTIRLFIFINVVIIIGMTVTGFAGWLSPITWGWLAEAGYAFPVFAIMNVLMIVFWVMFKLRYVLIPVLGMIICFVPTRTYCPYNLGGETPSGCIRVASYNTWGWGTSSEITATDEEKANMRHKILEYLSEIGADVVCLQESGYNWDVLHYIDSLIVPQMPYHDTIMTGSNHSQVMLFSRFPIVRKEVIKYETKGNISGAFTLNVNGRNVIVVNNHLETNSFSTDEKENFSDVIRGNQGRKAMAKESKFIVSKLTEQAKIRAPQADAVASFIRMHANTPLIVCGDFNDIPLSYTHNTIAEGLTDCFVATGTGLGFSYHKNSMRVRIDNIMCSEHFTPYNCRIDDSIDASDHYPIICDLLLEQR